MPLRVPAELLRCPATGQPLRPADAGPSRLVTADGARAYPVVDGVPVLIDGDACIFTAAEVAATAPRATANGAGRGRGSALRAIADRLTPSATYNPGAPERYRRFRREVLAARRPDRRARVLVVGGGQLGWGMEELAACADVELVETDVYLSPRVDVACDGHQLPFPDGAFDGAIAQAVLEHVACPARVVAEMHRVLAPGGIAYAETPFMQQVHEGAFDFTRFTELGHRRLFRDFDEVARGVALGPATGLLWSLCYFARALPRRSRRAAGLLERATLVAFGWLKYLDRALAGHRGAQDAAAGYWFMGRRADRPLPDRELVRDYRGLLASAAGDGAAPEGQPT